MREEILAYKRERILEEAVKLFYARGFNATTLDDSRSACAIRIEPGETIEIMVIETPVCWP